MELQATQMQMQQAINSSKCLPAGGEWRHGMISWQDPYRECTLNIMAVLAHLAECQLQSWHHICCLATHHCMQARQDTPCNMAACLIAL
jgi:hypothetical protein